MDVIIGLLYCSLRDLPWGRGEKPALHLATYQTSSVRVCSLPSYLVSFWNCFAKLWHAFYIIATGTSPADDGFIKREERNRKQREYRARKRAEESIEQREERNTKQREYRARNKTFTTSTTPGHGNPYQFLYTILCLSITKSNSLIFYHPIFFSSYEVHPESGCTDVKMTDVVGVSAIYEASRHDGKENGDPNESSDWLHRNDEYVRQQRSPLMSLHTESSNGVVINTGPVHLI